MNHMEERFLDYLDGHMSEADRAVFEKALRENPRLQASFEQFKRVAVLEKGIASLQESPGPAFSVKVMDALERPAQRAWWLMPAGSLAVALLALLVSHDFSGSYRSLAPPETVRDIAPAAAPQSTAAPEETKPQLPPGFREMEIMTDSLSGVEGFAKPNSRVDVHFSFQDKYGTKKVATIARFSKILSVGGQTNSSQGRVAVGSKIPVTVLVTERDARRIELARNLGELSLSAFGSNEVTGPRALEDPDTLDIADLTGTSTEANSAEDPIEGSMLTHDPKTGRIMKFNLNRGRWTKGADVQTQNEPPVLAYREEAITVLSSPELESYLQDGQLLKLVAVMPHPEREKIIAQNVRLKSIIRAGTETTTVLISVLPTELDAVLGARGTLKLLPAG